MITPLGTSATGVQGFFNDTSGQANAPMLNNLMTFMGQQPQQAGGQLWQERVESDEATTVVIEDGQVVEAAQEAAANG